VTAAVHRLSTALLPIRAHVPFAPIVRPDSFSSG
jgi:hypothetical protein